MKYGLLLSTIAFSTFSDDSGSDMEEEIDLVPELVCVLEEISRLKKERSQQLAVVSKDNADL